MNVFEAVQTRRTIRKFLDLPVEWAKVGNILIGAHYAPSAGNIQNWRFIVVTDREKRRKIADACLKQYWMEEAAVHIVICSNTEEMERYYDERGKTYDIQSAAAAAENMLLIAEEQGLGGAWVGSFEAEMLRSALAIPAKITPHMVLAFGYADERPPMPEKFHISDVTYINKWDNKIANLDLVMDNWSAIIKSKATDVKDALAKKGEKGKEEVLSGAKERARDAGQKLRAAVQKLKQKRAMSKAKKEMERQKRLVKRHSKK